MSLRLVKRLLQQTNDADTSDTDKPTSDQGARKQRLKKKKLERISVGKEEVVKHQIESMLFLDRKMASKDNKKNLTSMRLKQTLGQQKTDQVNAKMKIGSSRGSASELKPKPLPTFNKRRYQKQKEEKRLARIAMLLKKSSASKNAKK